MVCLRCDCDSDQQIHSDSNRTEHLNVRLTENDLTVLTGFPGPRLGSAELNGAQKQDQDHAHRSHRARGSRSGSVPFSRRFGTELPKFTNGRQEFHRQHEESALFPLGQPITAEQKITDRQAANRKRERDAVRPIRVRQMERDSPKKKSTPSATEREIEGGVPRFRNNFTPGVSKNICTQQYIVFT